MATTDIQWACAEALLDLLRDEMGTVQVSAAFPGDRAEKESVWIGDLESINVNVPVLKAGRKQRDDVFEIPVEIRVAASLDADETHVRLAELIAHVEDLLADNYQIDDFAGVVEAQLTAKRRTVQPTKAGYVGFAQLVVAVHSRLT